MKFITHWILIAVVFYALPYIPYIGDHFRVESFIVAIFAAIIFGLINAVIKPILKIVTLPLTIITFGLFAFILNIVLFWVVAFLVPGFDVPTIIGAILGAFVLSIAGWVIDRLL